jgi:hypothetical protein
MIMTAAVGVSLIIAGATLIWRRIQLVNDTLDAVQRRRRSPCRPAQLVGQCEPRLSTHGRNRRPVQGTVDRPAAHVTMGIGGLVPLLLTPVAYLVAGILAFTAAERLAKKRASLVATERPNGRAWSCSTPTRRLHFPSADRDRRLRRADRQNKPWSPQRWGSSQAWSGLVLCLNAERVSIVRRPASSAELGRVAVDPHPDPL